MKAIIIKVIAWLIMAIAAVLLFAEPNESFFFIGITLKLLAIPMLYGGVRLDRWANKQFDLRDITED